MDVWAVWSLFKDYVAESAKAACLLGVWHLPLFLDLLLHPFLGGL